MWHDQRRLYSLSRSISTLLACRALTLRITSLPGGAVWARGLILPTSLDQWIAAHNADECGSSYAPPKRRVLVEQPASEHARTKSKVDLARVASSQHTYGVPLNTTHPQSGRKLWAARSPSAPVGGSTASSGNWRLQWIVRQRVRAFLSPRRTCSFIRMLAHP